MLLSEPSNPRHLKVIPTGSLALDRALGIGGIPCGHISEIYGPESSGKTTICLSIVAEAQRVGGICAWIDADHSLDAAYAHHLGVDAARVFISEPKDSEQALDMALSLLRSRAIALIVIDSLTALAPGVEMRGSLGTSYYHQQEEIITQGLRKFSTALKQSETAILLTNQLRHRTGLTQLQPQTSTAGLTLKLHAALRLELQNPVNIFIAGIYRGKRLQVRIHKNKFVPTFPTIALELLYNQGIRRIGEIFDLALQYGLIRQKDSALWFGVGKIGQDRKSSLERLQKDDHLVIEIEQALRQRLFPPIPWVERK